MPITTRSTTCFCTVDHDEDVQPPRDPSSYGSVVDDEGETHHGGHEGTAVGGGQEAEDGEDHGDDGHGEHLDAVAHRDGEQHRVRGSAEHVAVHKLPAGLLLGLLGV